MLRPVTGLRFRSLGLLSVLAVVALAGAAAAQGSATFTVSLAGPDSPVSITGGQSQSVPIDITLMGDGFGCAQEAVLPVNVTASSSRLTPTVNPAGLEYTVPSGLYNSQVPANQAPPYNSTQPTSIEVSVPSGQTSGFTTQVTVTATFPGGNYGVSGEGNCEPGEFSSAEGTVAIDVSVQADATGGTDGGDGGTGGTDGGTGSDGGTGGDGGTNSSDDGDDGNGIPVGPWAIPAGLVAAALAARRRRQA